jgi:hypothetical protein
MRVGGERAALAGFKVHDVGLEELTGDTSAREIAGHLVSFV